ncbi:MAG: translation initiation factor IF-3 [Candidatus Altimarinota bacterium]
MRKTRSFPKNRKDEKRINEVITAPELAVISDAGEFLGKMSLSDALATAESHNLDLVEMGGMQEGVPLAKIMDYGKYIFKQQKQQAQNKSNTKKTELKTMKITYKIGDHDLDVRRKQAEKWAKEGNPMKVFLQLRGRENQYEDIAIEKIEEFIQSVESFYKKDDKSKLQKQGNTFNIILHPKK